MEQWQQGNCSGSYYAVVGDWELLRKIRICGDDLW